MCLTKRGILGGVPRAVLCCRRGTSEFPEKPLPQDSLSNELNLWPCASKRFFVNPRNAKRFRVELSQVGRAMKSNIRAPLLLLTLASSLMLCHSARAQQSVPSDTQLLLTYNANREVSLVGTVVKYETASAIPPMGAHVTI